MKCILMSCNNCNAPYAFEEVSKYVQKGMKVVCVPFASDLHWQLNGDFTNYKKQHFKVFESFGINEDDIDVVKLSEGRLKIIDKLNSADIIFFSGGFMENFMFIIEALDLEIYLNLVKDRKLFIGESAGTLVMLDKYTEVPFIEDAYRRFKRKEGLGFLYGLDLFVHYQKENKHHRRNKHVMQLLNSFEPKKIICLTDNSLMIYDDGETKLLGDYEVL